jgi:hypothetical protein
MTDDVVFVGGPGDARGFRLVGVTAVPPTAEAIARAVDRWLLPGQRRPALVIVSAAAFARASESLTSLEADPDGSIVVILPDEEEIAPMVDRVRSPGGRTEDRS